MLVNIFKKLGLGAKVKDPITTESIHSTGALFVDDSDLYEGLDGNTCAKTVWENTQKNIDQWGALLKGTGGALRGDKCYWYFLDYQCQDGEWSYKPTDDRELYITNTDGTKSQNQREEVTTSKRSLGVYNAPAGGNVGHLEYIRDKTRRWVNKMANGHLPSQMAWVAYKHQLWPGLRYGLGTMTNDIDEASNLLRKEEYNTLNLLGIASTVITGLRKLSPTFGGFGLYNLVTEQLISRINMLMQHYHTPTNIGRKLDVSLRLLQLQIGTAANPLLLEYDVWGDLAPRSWVKMLWKSLDRAQVKVHMKYDTIPAPREMDKTVMAICMEQGADKEKLLRLNRCRLALNIIFLSDMTTADGNYIEQSALEPCKQGIRSRYSFPREEPTAKDWEAWQTFWVSYTGVAHRLHHPLGRWTQPTHRLWEWFYDEEGDVLLRISKNTIERYRRQGRQGWSRSDQRYKRCKEPVPRVNLNACKPTLIRRTSNGTKHW